MGDESPAPGGIKALQVIHTSHLVALPNGGAVLVGAPPEALKILVLWEYPFPSTVVLPPDPLFANGINQASFEFLLYNHLFRMSGLRQRQPFLVVCDAGQRERMESLVRHMLRGTSESEMELFRTPAGHRRQLQLETAVVSGEAGTLRIDQMCRVVCFENGAVELPDGARLELQGNGLLRVSQAGESVDVPRQAEPRAQLPFYFPDVAQPIVGPKFGLQVIGSASGFTGTEWGSCFIIWINGQPLIVDGTPYLDDHLRRLGIEEDHILGYLITHNHEDHANAIGQLIGRRPVTILTSAPVMAGLVARLTAILDCAPDEVRKLFHWVPLHPSLERRGDPLHWFGAEIRCWYAIHTIPTLAVEISLSGKKICLPGDTLWGRQLEPLLEQRVISRKRYDLILGSYRGADVIVADAGGGPIHPAPEEVRELLSLGDESRLLVTHVPDAARAYLPSAEPGTAITLLPRDERTPEEAMALFGSPLLRKVPERWLLALLFGGDVIRPESVPAELECGQDAWFILAGRAGLCDGERDYACLTRGDLFHTSLAPYLASPCLVAQAPWTRFLRVPGPLYRAFARECRVTRQLQEFYRMRPWWRTATGEELGLEALFGLALLGRERDFGPGEDIVTQGQLAEHFYVVTTGSVQVVRRDGQDEELIGEFGPGYHFGEIALLDEELRTATVRAVGPVQVLELPAQAFRRHLMDVPLVRYRLHRLASERKADLARRKSARLLQNC